MARAGRTPIIYASGFACFARCFTCCFGFFPARCFVCRFCFFLLFLCLFLIPCFFFLVSFACFACCFFSAPFVRCFTYSFTFLRRFRSVSTFPRQSDVSPLTASSAHAQESSREARKIPFPLPLQKRKKGEKKDKRIHKQEGKEGLFFFYPLKSRSARREGCKALSFLEYGGTIGLAS